MEKQMSNCAGKNGSPFSTSSSAMRYTARLLALCSACLASCVFFEPSSTVSTRGPNGETYWITDSLFDDDYDYYDRRHDHDHDSDEKHRHSDDDHGGSRNSDDHHRHSSSSK